MKKIKLIIGLTLSLGLLFSFGTLKKSSMTNAGWAVASYFNAGDGTTAFAEGASGVAGAYAGEAAGLAAAEAGAELGVEIGAWAGPVGAIIGGGLGAL